ncbi:Kae1-associated serine/threonine protein kinase [Candidatus Pacearchaeota archaeon]|nr:Kae1-associated serine/threonine protein kinase [Candidatus Pacearchaeota archaeon]
MQEKEIIIGIGAEAILIKEKNYLIKKRIKKGYRNETLDLMLRKLRTRKEAKILEKVSKLGMCPKILKMNENEKTIEMDFIDGKKLSDYLDTFSKEKSLKICEIIGQNIAKLHSLNIIHGDLTTSNMIFVEKENKVYFIDFGLSVESQRIEDQAVDLRLLKQALDSRHFKNSKEFFNAVLSGYQSNKNYAKVLLQLQKVENRGRYKQKQLRVKKPNNKL